MRLFRGFFSPFFSRRQTTRRCERLPVHGNFCGFARERRRAADGGVDAHPKTARSARGDNSHEHPLFQAPCFLPCSCLSLLFQTASPRSGGEKGQRWAFKVQARCTPMTDNCSSPTFSVSVWRSHHSHRVHRVFNVAAMFSMSLVYSPFLSCHWSTGHVNHVFCLTMMVFKNNYTDDWWIEREEV